MRYPEKCGNQIKGIEVLEFSSGRVNDAGVFQVSILGHFEDLAGVHQMDS